jgi:ABC-type lipoprotein release transport system permease subunit
VHLDAHIALTTILLAVVLAIGGALIAGSFGGWQASRLSPADATAGSPARRQDTRCPCETRR